MRKTEPVRQIPALSLVCIFLLSLSQIPAASAATLDFFEEPFNAVLDNLMTNYWSPEDNGTWISDAGYDSPQYSTELLYPLGMEEGDPLCTERANRTVEYVIGIAGLEQLLQKIADGRSLDEEGASLPANIYGHRYYSGSSPYDFAGELPIICSVAGDLVRQGYEMYPLNEFSAPGVIAYYELLLAYNFRNKGSSRQAASLARKAYDLLAWADATWVQIDEDTGYYDAPTHMHGVWDWAIILQALSLAYKASGNDLYLDKALDLLNYLEDYWDPTLPYGYCTSAPPCTRKYLSGNHLMCKALLILHDATRDPAWLDRAEKILEFMTNPTAMYTEDPDFPGFFIFSHDWSSYSGPALWACSGCNFAVLAAIYVYNRLEAEGPDGVDLLPTCMIATSAFGSPMRNKIDVLRAFRDRFLLTSDAGRAFVQSYYRYGPPVADWIGRHGRARPFVRTLLLPLIGFASLFV